MRVEISGINELSDKLRSMRFAIMVKQILDGIASIVERNSKINAPVLTGALRSSLSTEFSRLSFFQSMVGSKLPYAGIREIENNKHPDTKYYLKRGYTEHLTEINSLIENNLKQWL